MILFDKLTTFRRLVGSVPYVRSRKNFYSRFLTRLTSFNIESDFCYLNLDKVTNPGNMVFRLVDVIEVPSSCLQQDIIINVYACLIDNTFTPNIYYTLYV